MKHILFLFVCFYAAVSYGQGQKKALIIAVGDYPKEGKWGKISSEKDIPLIVSALHHHGFTDDNILIIQDSQATKEGIKSAFEKITRDAEEGDVFVVHYSGHGQQVWDKNGDELDGKDESIVPFDAPMKFIKNQYEGQNHILDDELEFLIGELRMKLTAKGSLTVILDACHSGTATRGSEGLAPSRGTTEFMGPEDWKEKPGKDENGFELKVKTRGAEEPDNLAPMVLFSGASASQLNYETFDEQGNSVGSLSYTISKVLLNSDKQTTYQEIFDQIKIEMNVITPRQNPQVEGDVNRAIFGGKGAAKTNYFIHTTVIDGKTSVLNGGTLSGLFNKSKVALFPAGTKEIQNKTPIATGVIANANLVNADVIWDKEVDKEILRKGFVFITEQNFENVQLKVFLNIPSNPDLLSALKKNIKQYEQVIVLTKNAPEVSIAMSKVATRGMGQIELISNSDMLISSNPVTENVDSLSAVLTKELLNYAQALFLRDLKTVNTDFDLVLELIPITEVEKVVSGEGRYKKTVTVEKARGAIQDKIVNGRVQLDSGDMFKLKITNKGTKVAYFTLLDITPTNEVAVIIPGKNQAAEEFVIRPGESIELSKIYTISPPYGMETFKLIATPQAVDLRQIVSSRGNTERTVSSPFEKLIQSSYVENTRGVNDNEEDIAIPPDAANVHTFLFEINQKQNKP